MMYQGYCGQQMVLFLLESQISSSLPYSHTYTHHILTIHAMLTLINYQNNRCLYCKDEPAGTSSFDWMFYSPIQLPHSKAVVSTGHLIAGALTWEGRSKNLGSGFGVCCFCSSYPSPGPDLPSFPPCHGPTSPSLVHLPFQLPLHFPPTLCGHTCSSGCLWVFWSTRRQCQQACSTHQWRRLCNSTGNKKSLWRQLLKQKRG